VSRGTWVVGQQHNQRVTYGTLTPCGPAFQPGSVTLTVAPSVNHDGPADSHDPRPTTGGPLTWTGFRHTPVRSPLLGGSRLLSLRPGTEMFQFPDCPHVSYGFPDACPDSIGTGCPIRTSPDHGLRAAPRCVSWLATSFLGTGSQSILRTPLVA
jgi:hypothetical protein